MKKLYISKYRETEKTKYGIFYRKTQKEWREL